MNLTKREEQIIKDVLLARSNWKQNKLSLKDPIRAGTIEEEKTVWLKRINLLADTLYHFYWLWKNTEAREVLGEKFLAFVGNEIIRKWPFIDIAFHSNNLGDEKGILEHTTPISFFRDLFQNESWTRDHFYWSLVLFHRTMRISLFEDAKLNEHKMKTTRPANAYELVDINVLEIEKWNAFYDDYDTIIRSISDKIE